MQLDYSYVNTDRSLHFNQIFVHHWKSGVEHIFFDSDSWVLTPAKYCYRLRLPVKTFDSRLRLCNIDSNSENFMEYQYRAVIFEMKPKRAAGRIELLTF